MARASSAANSTGRTAFARQLPRPVKRRAGSTSVEQTPLAIRTSGVTVDRDLNRYVRERFGSKLGKFASRIERVTVRFEDINGPRGGIDTVCRIKVVLSGMASVVIQQSAAGLREAFDLAADRAERTVRRTLGRKHVSGRKSPRHAGAAKEQPGAAAGERAGKRRSLPLPDGGSSIGRRVGRGDDKVERLLDAPAKRRRDEPVDTALAGWSATDRRAGGSSTAARNVQRRAPRASATLEDSARDRPSRKSTRRSANRLEQGNKLGRREVARASSPQARATKASVRQ